MVVSLCQATRCSGFDDINTVEGFVVFSVNRFLFLHRKTKKNGVDEPTRRSRSVRSARDASMAQPSAMQKPKRAPPAS
jgi:hypothetical protein